MHATNSSRPANKKLFIPASVIFALKDLILGLEDRARYDALLVLATLQAIVAVQINYMCVQKIKSIVDKSNFAALIKLPNITVPKLMAENYDIFTTAFCCVVERNILMNGITIDYVMRGVTGNYNSPLMACEYKLNNCFLHTGDYFKNDNINLY